MNIFKRIGLFLFGIAGIITLGTLSLPWVGPWTKIAANMLTHQWYFTMVEICVGITAIGVLYSFIRSIFAPRKKKTVTVSKSNGDQVSVSTAAISSQAAHVIEANQDYHAERVVVNARRGKVNVAVRVRPVYAVNVTEEGKRLHDALVSGLSEICGDAVGRIFIEFVEADSHDQKPEYMSLDNDDYRPVSTSKPSASYASLDDASYEITVPMGGSSSHELTAATDETSSSEEA